jgi:hypothetical protein
MLRTSSSTGEPRTGLTGVRVAPAPAPVVLVGCACGTDETECGVEFATATYISPRRRHLPQHTIAVRIAEHPISAARGTSPAKVRPPIRRHDGAPKLISPSISSTQHIPFPHVTRNSKMERHALGPFTPPRLLALAPSSSFPLLPLGMIAPSLPARSSHNGRTSGAHQ